MYFSPSKKTTTGGNLSPCFSLSVHKKQAERCAGLRHASFHNGSEPPCPVCYPDFEQQKSALAGASVGSIDPGLYLRYVKLNVDELAGGSHSLVRLLEGSVSKELYLQEKG
jgi:hypothetical protein